MDRILCDNPDRFFECLEQAESLAQEKDVGLFIYFTGAKNIETGRSWCGDCTRAEPLVNTALGSIEGGCVLLEVPIERDVYRQPDFHLRTDTKIQLKCVPTLMKWVRGRALGRLDDRQSQKEELISDLIEA